MAAVLAMRQCGCSMLAVLNSRARVWQSNRSVVQAAVDTQYSSDIVTVSSVLNPNYSAVQCSSMATVCQQYDSSVAV